MDEYTGPDCRTCGVSTLWAVRGGRRCLLCAKCGEVFLSVVK